MTQETTGETLFTLVAVTRTSSSIQHVTIRRAGQRNVRIEAEEGRQRKSVLLDQCWDDKRLCGSSPTAAVITPRI